jgi:CTP:molybdopterin cytidylyltransferase MocA
MRNGENAGALILAAGLSKRMRYYKPLLPFDDKFTFLEKIIFTYSGWGCIEIIVIVNEEVFNFAGSLKNIPPEVTFVINRHLEYDRFFSVKLGLEKMSKSEYCFIHNADNPFINHEILDLLYAERSPDEYISPVFMGMGGHPVLINRKNMDYLSNYPQNDANLKKVMREMKCKKVRVNDDAVLVNINDREEYDKLINSKKN